VLGGAAKSTRSGCIVQVAGLVPNTYSGQTDRPSQISFKLVRVKPTSGSARPDFKFRGANRPRRDRPPSESAHLAMEVATLRSLGAKAGYQMAMTLTNQTSCVPSARDPAHLVVEARLVVPRHQRRLNLPRAAAATPDDFGGRGRAAGVAAESDTAAGSGDYVERPGRRWNGPGGAGGAQRVGIGDGGFEPEIPLSVNRATVDCQWQQKGLGGRPGSNLMPSQSEALTRQKPSYWP
jgi:hypothetical protein